MEICTFGEHLTLDGYGGNFDHLNNAERVGRCLSAAAAARRLPVREAI